MQTVKSRVANNAGSTESKKAINALLMQLMIHEWDNMNVIRNTFLR